MRSPELRHPVQSPAAVPTVCSTPATDLTTAFVRREREGLVVDLAAAERASSGITRLPEHSSYEQVSQQLQQRHRDELTRRRLAWAAGLIGFPAVVALAAQLVGLL